MEYDHRRHAGNAGDLWKHLILVEATDHLLSRQDDDWIYVESHAGHPEHLLEERGEWVGGVGRTWHLLPRLRRFRYFEILGDMNPCGLKLYPGSTALVMEVARRTGAKLNSLIWDKNPSIERKWSSCDQHPEVRFHLGDGFAGVNELIEDLPSALLLIDPPYLDEAEVRMASRLFNRAVAAGWTVLHWQMMDQCTLDLEDELGTYELIFDEAGLDCGKWRGASVAIGGGDDLLREHLDLRMQEFLRMLKGS